MKTNGNDSAFDNGTLDPKAYTRTDTQPLTKREYFAGLAMQGLCTNPKVVDGSNAIAYVWMANQAVIFADFLIEALNEEAK